MGRPRTRRTDHASGLGEGTQTGGKKTRLPRTELNDESTGDHDTEPQPGRSWNQLSEVKASDENTTAAKTATYTPSILEKSQRTLFTTTP